MRTTAARYVRSGVPRGVPAGKVLVYNHVRPVDFHSRTPVGAMGFRAWTRAPDPKALRVCRCGWAPDVPQHYRMAWVKTYKAVSK
jgi:hypothetical protein